MRVRLNLYLVISYCSLFLLGLLDNIRGPLFPEMIQEFGLSHGHGSWFFALASFFGMVGGFVSHYAMKWVPVYLMFVVSFVCLGTGSLLISQASQFEVVLSGAFFFGWAFGFLAVVQNLWVSQSTLPQHRSRYLTFLHTMYGLASFVAPYLALVGSNWRTPFFVVMFLSYAFALSVFFFKLPNITNRTISSDDGSNDPTAPPDQNGGHSMWYMGILFAGYIAIELLVGSRMPTLLREAFEMSKSSASEYLSTFFLGLLGGRLLYLFYPIHNFYFVPISFFLSAASMLGGLYIHPWLLPLTGLFFGPIYPLLMSKTAELFPHHTGHAMSICIGMSSFLVVCMHLGVGILSDTIGIKSTFLLVPFVGAISGFMYLRLKAR